MFLFAIINGNVWKDYNTFTAILTIIIYVSNLDKCIYSLISGRIVNHSRLDADQDSSLKCVLDDPLYILGEKIPTTWNKK